MRPSPQSFLRFASLIAARIRARFAGKGYGKESSNGDGGEYHILNAASLQPLPFPFTFLAPRRSLLFLEEDLRGALGIPEAGECAALSCVTVSVAAAYLTPNTLIVDTNADDSDTSDLPQSVPPPVPPDVEELEENLDEILFGAGRTGDSGRSSEEDTSSGSEGWTLEEGIESEEEG